MTICMALASYENPLSGERVPVMVLSKPLPIRLETDNRVMQRFYKENRLIN